MTKILLACLLAWSAPRAAVHYVRSGAAGNNDGSDWTNAWTGLPADLVRSDTYYIADGEYGAYEFDDDVAGTTYIYVKKAVTDDHGTETGWDTSYGDGEALFESHEKSPIRISTGYMDIDGQTGGDTSGHGFRFHALDKVSAVVVAYDPTWSHDTLTHINLRHCGMHHRGAEIFIPEGEFTVTAAGDRIRVPDASRYNSNGGDQIRVESSGMLPAGLRPGTGYTGQAYYVRNRDLDGNTVQLYPTNNPGAPVTGMDQGTGTHSFYLRAGNRGFQVHSQANMAYSLLQHCYIHDVPSVNIYFSSNSHDNTVEYCWLARDHSDSVSHAEGIQSGGRETTNNMIIRHCVFEDIEGTAVIVACHGWQIYGNLFYYTTGYPNPGQGGGYCPAIYAHGINNIFFNNTIYGKISGSYGTTFFNNADGPNYVLNNIWAHCGGHMGWQDGVRYDYNLYYDMRDAWAEGYLANLAENEPHSLEAQACPFVDTAAYDFRLCSEALAGTTLTQPYNEDRYGTPRGSDGTWNVGAFEYNTSSVPHPVAGPPFPDRFSRIPNPLRIGDIGHAWNITDLDGNPITRRNIRTGIYLINRGTGPVRRMVVSAY